MEQMVEVSIAFVIHSVCRKIFYGNRPIVKDPCGHIVIFVEEQNVTRYGSQITLSTSETYICCTIDFVN